MTGLALVTGGTGFIGHYLARKLIARSVPLRVLARNPDRLSADVRDAVDVVRGDIRDRDALARAVNGATTVFHLAAFARAWARDNREFEDVNTTAVETLLELSEAHGVRRVVHVSTILTLPPYRAAPVNGACADPTPYEATKLAGERLVDEYAANGLDAVTVHPTRVYGPGPLNDANGVTKAIALYLRGRLRVRLADGDALANYVHADDVAEGIILAATRGSSGSHHVLGGENASFSTLLELVSTLTGKRRRTVSVPPRVGVAMARAAEVWGRVGGRVPITRPWVRTLLEDRRVSTDHARAHLGYAPRSLRRGLVSTIHWLEIAGHWSR